MIWISAWKRSIQKKSSVKCSLMCKSFSPHAPPIKVEWQSAKSLLLMEHAGYRKYFGGVMTSAMLSRAGRCLCKGGTNNSLLALELHLNSCARLTRANCTLGSFGHNKCTTLSQFIHISVIIHKVSLQYWATHSACE